MFRARTCVAKALTPSLALLLVVGVLWMPATALAGRHDAGWTEFCPHVMTTNDDPIFYPGQPGASVSHDFFGNLGTDANSTFDSLRQGQTSCVATPYDTSAYWSPVLLKGGKPVEVKTMFQYYWAPPGNDGSQVVPTPPGLKMYGDRVWWTCGGGGSTGPMGNVKAPQKKEPFDCSPWPGSRVTAIVFLPNCWDGVNLDSPDHMSHMAYPNHQLGCPPDHPVVLAGLFVSVNWYLTDGTGATLSTGPISTFRAMFFNAWDPNEMARLTKSCMNNDFWCGDWSHSGQNRAPVVKAATIIPADVYDTVTPSAVAVNPHDPDGDPFTLHYQWQVNGQNVGTDDSNLGYQAFEPGDLITVTITAVDDHGNWSVPVTSKPSTVDYDVVAPKPGKPGGVLVNVHGGGFGPHESVPLHLNSQSGPVLATVTTDVLGLFPNTDIQLPQKISGGSPKLYGVGQKSGIVGWGPFSVSPVGDLTPGALAVGDTGNFSGDGYVGGETVSLAFANQPPQQVVADEHGSVAASLVAPAEPGPIQSLTVTSSAGSTGYPYHVTPTLTVPSSGEPSVPMPFSLTGYGANENVELYVDDVDSGQRFAADATGRVDAQVAVDTTFGQHQLKFTGKTTGISASTHVAMPAYVTLTPSSGPVGTQVTVSSEFGWPQGDTVSFSWDKVHQADLTADSSGSVSTTFTVPAHKPGNVVARLSDLVLGASPSASFTITSFHYQGGPSHTDNLPPKIKAVVIDGASFTNSTFTGIAHGVKDPDGDPVTLHYTWKLNGKQVGGDNQTYSSSGLVAGDVLDLWIRPEDNHGNWGDSVHANAPVTMRWEIVAPDAQPTLTSHPADLYNFQPFEVVDVRIDSPTGHKIDSITVNGSGNAFGKDISIPWPLAGGPHVLYGVGESSGIVGQGPINILPVAFAVRGLLHVGDPTVLSASGFRPGETVTASFPHNQGISQVADGTGTVIIDMTMPEEPYPGGDITVQAPSGTAYAPYRTWSSMTMDATVAEPHDNVGFHLHGYGANEVVQGSIDGTVVQTYTTNADGSLSATVPMDSYFGKHHVTMTGLTLGRQPDWKGLVHSCKIYLKPYVTVTPNPAKVGDVLTITSLYGWVPLTDTVYLYWGRDVVQVLTPDSAGSIVTTYVVPSHKPGTVTLKLLDKQLGKYATFKLTLVQ